MEFNQLIPKSSCTESKELLNTAQYIPKGKDFDSFKTRHKRKLAYLMSCLCLWSSRLLTNSELFTKPASFKDLGGVYETSVKSECTACLALPDPEDPWIIRMHVNVSIAKTMLINIDMRNLVTKDLIDRYGLDRITSAYMYIIHCFTAFNQKNTCFFHIDDDKKLEAARDRVESGNYELPKWEYMYLDLEHNDSAMSSEIWESTTTHKIKDNKIVIDNTDLPLPINRIPYPQIDMDKVEDRFYNLFAYLLKTQKIIGEDIETTGLDIFQDTIVSMGFSFDTKVGFYVSLDHAMPPSKALYIGERGVIRSLAHSGIYLRSKYEDSSTIKNAIRYMDTYGENAKNISRKNFVDIINTLKSKLNIFHNAKFDYNVILTETGTALPIFIDTMLAHYVARPGFDDPVRDKRGLKIIAQKELGVPGWKADLKRYKNAEKDLAAAYNVRDTCYMLAIALRLQHSLDSMHKLFYDVEMKFLPVLMHAEREGVGLDVDKLKKIEAELKEKMDRIETKFQSIYNSEMEDTVLYNETLPSEDRLPIKAFNINSGPILKDLFYTKMGIIPPRKCPLCGNRHNEEHFECTNESCDNYGQPDSAILAFSTPTGDPSLDKFALKGLLKFGVEEAKELMEYRAASKLVSSYTNLDEKLHPLTGKLHPSYHQARTATGRLSSSRPNFQ